MTETEIPRQENHLCNVIIDNSCSETSYATAARHINKFMRKFPENSTFCMKLIDGHHFRTSGQALPLIFSDHMLNTLYEEALNENGREEINQYVCRIEMEVFPPKEPLKRQMVTVFQEREEKKQEI